MHCTYFENSRHVLNVRKIRVGEKAEKKLVASYIPVKSQNESDWRPLNEFDCSGKSSLTCKSIFYSYMVVRLNTSTAQQTVAHVSQSKFIRKKSICEAEMGALPVPLPFQSRASKLFNRWVVANFGLVYKQGLLWNNGSSAILALRRNSPSKKYM